LLGRVSGALSELSGKATGAPDFDRELVTLRDQIAEAKPEDIPALVEQMTRLSAIAQRYGKGRDLPLDPESPYFAHLRLREDERPRDVLIGKRGFIDRSRRVQIVDWRNAPVSRIYYRYEEEDDYEEQFGDRVAEGTVEVRRAVTIDGGHLRRVACPQGTYVAGDGDQWYEREPAPSPELSGGQGKAARPPQLRRGDKRSRLGEHDGRALRADKHLPDIVALIDAEQFNLITQPQSGLVVLQGGAGSGKTTVALHRVAYLCYQRPKLFRPDKVAIVLPSRAMVRYVERVLPSLGVRGIRVLTVRSWFERTRHRVLPHVTKRYNDHAPAVVIRLKKHPMMLELLREHVTNQRSEMDAEVRDHLRSLGPVAEELRERWEKPDSRALTPRLAQLRDELRKLTLSALARQQGDTLLRRLLQRARDVMSDWSEVLTDRQLLADAVRRHCPGEFGEREIEQVCRWCTRQSSGLTAGSAPATPDEDDEHVAADGRTERVEDTPGRLDPADDALLLYLVLLKRGALRGPDGKNVRYEHIVIDEAQDLAAIELKVLLETAAPRHSVTLAGDTAQRLVFDNAFTSWETLLDRLELPLTSNTTLQLGYRSTAEVMALARSLLGDSSALAPQRSTRAGAPVELHRFNDEGEVIAMLGEALRSLMLREPLASVALIARHPSQAQAYEQALRSAEVPGIRLVRDQDFSFRPGIEVTDATQVKGLEFDYVVLLDVTANSYPDTLEARHLLHIGATRAAHQLWLLAVGTPSPLLPPTL
jgi:DNA helicase-2/ATP-dependent DNA helicase PcrA